MKTIVQKKKDANDYFNRARTWADDTFGQLQASRNRYQAAFLIAMGVNIAAIAAVGVLAGTHKLVPMLVHHYDNGITTVEPLDETNAPINKAQVESDIVRYITHRESWDSNSYRAQFDLIRLLSSESVENSYIQEQDKGNKTAPIHALGTESIRKVHIYSVNFLDNQHLNTDDLPKNHQNVAEVVFTLSDTDKRGGVPIQHHYSALISWAYLKPSQSPAERWLNWDGFQVTSYSRQVRNV